MGGFVNWVVVPALIFCARIMDVSIGTVRVICLARGIRWLSALLGFFEVLIWLIAMGQIMQRLDCPLNYVAYAAGFATGNVVGIWLSERLAIGFVTVQVITQLDAAALVQALRRAGYGLTVVDAQGLQGPVKLIYAVIRRGELGSLLALVREFNPKAFFTVEDVRALNDGATLQGELYRQRQLLRKTGGAPDAPDALQK